jgi:endogenous inhibitor of DNA gyrase (YacG/DUF329 family)
MKSKKLVKCPCCDEIVDAAAYAKYVKDGALPCPMCGAKVLIEASGQDLPPDAVEPESVGGFRRRGPNWF